MHYYTLNEMLSGRKQFQYISIQLQSWQTNQQKAIKDADSKMHISLEMHQCKNEFICHGATPANILLTIAQLYIGTAMGTVYIQMINGLHICGYSCPFAPSNIQFNRNSLTALTKCIQCCPFHVIYILNKKKPLKL